MASTEQITATIKAHVAAVGAADVDALPLLYAEEADLQDPAGTTVDVGLSAIRSQLFGHGIKSPMLSGSESVDSEPEFGSGGSVQSRDIGMGCLGTSE